MTLHRSRNHNSVDVTSGNELPWRSDALQIRIRRADMFYACDVLITNYFELAMRKASEVPNQKRPPITTSKHANRDLFLHDFGAFAKRKIVVGGRGLSRGDS